MATDYKQVNSKYASISIVEYGDIVVDLEDIRQSIYLIVSTRLGTAPFRPDFGCGIFEKIDRPINIVAPEMSRDIHTAIDLFESRVKVKDVTYVLSDSSAIFTINYSVNSDVASTFKTGISILNGVITLI